MKRVLPLLLVVVNVAIAALVASACGRSLPGPALCSANRACEDGQSCTLGRCRPRMADPVAIDAQRLAFSPVDLAQVNGSGESGRTELDAAFRLGKKGDVAQVLLRFAVKLPADARLQRALLVLEPLPRCERRAGRVSIELAQVLASWTSQTVARTRLPRTGLPMRAGDFAIMPVQPIRIDVTELVSDWLRHRRRYHGLLLSASGTSPTGGCYATGAAEGRGPSLELFFQTAPPDAGTDAADAAGDGSADAAGDAAAADAATDGGVADAANAKPASEEGE